ncbi:MAG: hypothetical protein JKX80_00635 [Candidatus Pacebacteria bacterium]|nr:hypothetical protein [Candidatus Paceibacterota bacterium]
MVNVSKKKISKEIKNYLHTQLIDLFIAHSTRKELSRTLFEVLSPSEQIMLAKRVGIIGLLVHKYSTYEIIHIFKVGMGTVLRLQKQLELGKLEHIEKIFKRKKARASLIGMIETALTLGITGSPQKHLRIKANLAIDSWKSGSK